MHLSLKTNNHMHSQHTLKTLYIQVFLIYKIKQKMNKFNDKTTSDNIHFKKKTYICI